MLQFFLLLSAFWYWCFYPRTSRHSVYPICGILINTSGWLGVTNLRCNKPGHLAPPATWHQTALPEVLGGTYEQLHQQPAIQQRSCSESCPVHPANQGEPESPPHHASSPVPGNPPIC